MQQKTYLYFRHVRFFYWDSDGNLRQREGHGVTVSDFQITTPDLYQDFVARLQAFLEHQHGCKITDFDITSLSLIGSTEEEQ